RSRRAASASRRRRRRRIRGRGRFASWSDCHPGEGRGPIMGSRAVAATAAPGMNSERSDELLRFFLLRGGAFLGDFLENLASAILVADLQVGLGQLELGADRLPARARGG